MSVGTDADIPGTVALTSLRIGGDTLQQAIDHRVVVQQGERGEGLEAVIAGDEATRGHIQHRDPAEDVMPRLDEGDVGPFIGLGQARGGRDTASCGDQIVAGPQDPLSVGPIGFGQAVDLELRGSS